MEVNLNLIFIDLLINFLLDLEGYIICPKAFEFCRLFGDLSCPDGCSGRGMCRKGECICDPGFKGESCNFYEDQNIGVDCIWPFLGEECKLKDDGCLLQCVSFFIFNFCRKK